MKINMGNFLSAVEMRNHTNEIISDAVKLELEKLYELMYKSKHYSINISDLSVGAAKFLKDKGYEIRHLCDQSEGESYFIISWK